MADEKALALQRGAKLGNAPTIDKMLHTPAVTERLKRIAIGSFNPDRIAAQLILASRKVPSLLECSQESVFLALMEAMRLGLEPDGVQGALVPFNSRQGKQATFMPMVQGVVGAMIADGVAKAITAETVYEHDLFVVRLGTAQEIEHIPAPWRHDDKRRDDRGKMIAAYAVAILPDGSRTFRSMTEHDVLRRKQASRASGKDDSPWQTWPEEMWRKTALKGLGKWLGARTARLRAILDADARADKILATGEPETSAVTVEAKIDERERGKAMAKLEEWDAADEQDATRAALPAAETVTLDAVRDLDDDEAHDYEEHRRRAEEEADRAFARMGADEAPSLPGIEAPRREADDR